VWTSTELLVWNASTSSSCPSDESGSFAYNPRTGATRTLPAIRLPSVWPPMIPTYDVRSAVWTGSEVVIATASGEVAYNPATGEQRSVSVPTNGLYPAVVGGQLVTVVGRQAEVLDATTGTWRPAGTLAPDVPLLLPYDLHGRVMLVPFLLASIGASPSTPLVSDTKGPPYIQRSDGSWLSIGGPWRAGSMGTTLVVTASGDLIACDGDRAAILRRDVVGMP
jgi:hypothetical protein